MMSISDRFDDLSAGADRPANSPLLSIATPRSSSRHTAMSASEQLGARWAERSNLASRSSRWSPAYRAISGWRYAFIVPGCDDRGRCRLWQCWWSMRTAPAQAGRAQAPRRQEGIFGASSFALFIVVIAISTTSRGDGGAAKLICERLRRSHQAPGRCWGGSPPCVYLVAQ